MNPTIPTESARMHEQNGGSVQPYVQAAPSNELPDALIDAHLGLAYQSSGLNAMTGESWDRVVARRFFALGMATAAGLIEMPAHGANVYEQRLRAVLDVVQRYLPPGGIYAHDAMTEIIGLVDPWPDGGSVPSVQRVPAHELAKWRRLGRPSEPAAGVPTCGGGQR